MDIEAKFGELRGGGDLPAAATALIEGYGPEVLGFLVTFLRDESAAADVFAQACEDLWVGLPRFEGRASARTWFYVLARHAAARHRRSPHVRGGRHVGLSVAEEVAERVRTGTLPHLRTTAKTKLQEIRDALDPDDRALLVLRIDRGLEWNDIAHVLVADDPDLARASARLRKRFETVKNEVRDRARKAGLLDK